LDRDVGPSVPAAEEVHVPEFTDAEPDGGALPAADPNGCAPSTADPNGCVVCVADEDDCEEEDEVPLTRKNSRKYVASGESSGVPSPALSALIGLQNCPWRILIRLLRIWFQRICYQSQQMMV
jgi:hypothetical protein